LVRNRPAAYLTLKGIEYICRVIQSNLYIKGIEGNLKKGPFYTVKPVYKGYIEEPKKKGPFYICSNYIHYVLDGENEANCPLSTVISYRKVPVKYS
jgi:hypothetical protein